MKLIFGHKNPDTDTICSALVLERIKKQQNEEVKAVALGKVNKETNFVLNYLNLKAPDIIAEVLDNQEVILVDHNEFNQSVTNIEKANILEVYDHHRINNFQTAAPLLMNVKPVGCTATILYQKCLIENIKIDQEMATLMLSAIISDSLLFKSPTCTAEDVSAANDLADIAQIKLEEYGMEMLKAGTDLDDFQTVELLDIDTKEFNTNNGKYEVGQINTVDIDELITKRNNEFILEIPKRIDSKKLDVFMLVITDIVNSNSIAYIFGNDAKRIAEKFNQELENNIIKLPGVVSRKKQIVPFL